MKQKIKTKLNKINVGKLGLNTVGIPMITIGEGNPQIAIICGMHGNEHSGLFVIQKLVSMFHTINFKGTMNIVLGANSWAQSLNIRVQPTQIVDLNRIFPGDPKGEIGDRVAHKLFVFCQRMDIVIDLHTFNGICPIVGLFMNTGKSDVKQKNINLLKQFNPDAVWKLNFNLKEETDLVGALGPRLCQHNIPNIAIETPNHDVITEKQINKTVSGLINILENRKHNNKLGIFERKNIRSDDAGLFMSDVKPMTKIIKNQEIGKFVQLPNMKEAQIRSPHEGTIIINHKRAFVSTGDLLFSIGEEVNI